MAMMMVVCAGLLLGGLFGVATYRSGIIDGMNIERKRTPPKRWMEHLLIQKQPAAKTERFDSLLQYDGREH